MAFTMTDVLLLKVPLENDYKHTLYFDSISAQESYFRSKMWFSNPDYSYQRKDNIIRFHIDYDDVAGCNYVMYRNNGHSSKWYYAFITKMEYVSDGRTDIYIETDVIQTYMFDYKVKASFIEREHTKDDTVGANTVPEGLETGEYVIADIGYDNQLGAETNTYIVLAVSEYPDSDGNFHDVQGDIYGGSYSGLKYIPLSTAESVNNLLALYAEEGKTEAIHCIFMAPAYLITIDSETGEYKSGYTPVHWDTSFGEAPTTLDGYTPRNKKLLTYPYTYLNITNNQGVSAILHNEKFYDGGARTFRNYGVLCPGCSIRMVPLNYNKNKINHSEGINLGKYPICNWTSDVYTNWLTQNGINHTVSVGLAGGTAGLGAAAIAGLIPGVGTLAGAGMLASGVISVLGTVGEVYQHSLTPPQLEGNINCGDVMFAGKINTFQYTDMTIKAEYARIIDDFFSMFGYKTNRVKTPNSNHRANYWYTKTIDVNIDGDIPSDDIQKIKNAYNAGLTFWKNPANIGDYSVDNSII